MTGGHWNRLIDDRMAVRAGYRAWLQPDVRRLAQLVLWRTYGLHDARLEARLAMLRVMRRAGSRTRLTAETRAFADEVLGEAIDHLEQHLDGCRTELQRVAATARRQGAWGMREVMADVIAAARSMDPTPPTWLVEEAAEPPPRAIVQRRRPVRQYYSSPGARAHA